MDLVSLQFKTTNDFQANLDKLVSLILEAPKGALILAPELCLSGYSYDCMDMAVDISSKAIDILANLSLDKTIVLTLMQKQDDKYLNTLYIFHKGKISHTQSKKELFKLNNEDQYFKAGSEDDIKIVEIDGIKIASLICFELRFINLWEKLKGADIILIPAMWGIKRKEHFQVLSQALAIANQCFVIASNSANDDMAKSSAIITPFGKSFEDDTKELLHQKIELSEIKKMRRYLPVF